MKFTCNIDNKGHLKFYLVHRDSKISIRKSECLKYGKQKISEYLNKFDLFIRPINKEDIKYLQDVQTADELCGDMDLNIFPILSDMIEITNTHKNVDVSNITQNDSTRLTYVLCHTSNPKIILGFVSAVINYKEKAFLSGGHPIKGFYRSIIHRDSLFVDLGCGSKKYNKIVSGTNYFIRAYVLLVSLENRPVNVIWGQSSGSIGDSSEKLFELHEKRGCTRVDKSQFYECDVFRFLNEFFRRLDTNDLLQYTNRLSKKNN